MQTNIALDEELVKEALRYAPVQNERELVDLALREFIANHKRRDLRELKGRINFFDAYDYKALRTREQE
jgi:Arc/MetJ family transcription regulator